MSPSHESGPIPCGGVFADEFDLGPGLSMKNAPDYIEADRIVMAARPGLNRKLLPFGLEDGGARATCGGFYLFDTLENAVAFKHWVEKDFVVDGIHFLDRPVFKNPRGFVYRVVGAEDFKPLVGAQRIVRSERWVLPNEKSAEQLAWLWPAMRSEAQSTGLSSIWLLVNAETLRVALVTVADRLTTDAARQPDIASVGGLAASPSLGFEIGQRLKASKEFDRSSWIYSIWFPAEPNDAGPKSLWPNSPPFSAPAHWKAAAA